MFETLFRSSFAASMHMSLCKLFSGGRSSLFRYLALVFRGAVSLLVMV